MAVNSRHHWTGREESLNDSQNIFHLPSNGYAYQYTGTLQQRRDIISEEQCLPPIYRFGPRSPLKLIEITFENRNLGCVGSSLVNGRR